MVVSDSMLVIALLSVETATFFVLFGKIFLNYKYCLQKDLLQNVLGKAPDTFRVLFASVTDHFELCLAKCRTSSQSVQHENSYKDPKAKYCYGDSPASSDNLVA